MSKKESAKTRAKEIGDKTDELVKMVIPSNFAQVGLNPQQQACKKSIVTMLMGHYQMGDIDKQIREQLN
jgi:hypothetical protein